MLGLIERVKEAELLDDAMVWDFEINGEQATVHFDFGGGAYCAEAQCHIDKNNEVTAHLIAVEHEDNLSIGKHLKKEAREWVVKWVEERLGE